MMAELEHDDRGDVHVYECKPWDPMDEIYLSIGDPIVKLSCVYCKAEVCSYEFTAKRCATKGHHALCPACMDQLKAEQGNKFKDGGYVRANKLERYQ